MNRLYFGDNLKWLSDRKEFPDASVDLVYLDPPFNSNADYNVLFREPTGQVSQAQFHAFTDTWSWADAADTAGSRDGVTLYPYLSLRVVPEVPVPPVPGLDLSVTPPPPFTSFFGCRSRTMASLMSFLSRRQTDRITFMRKMAFWTAFD
jgi:hypothetical protein